MNKKRLIRDTKMFFQFFPYHQIYMDNELVKGWVGINYLTDGDSLYWDYFKKTGPVQVTGKGVTWLTVIPEDKSRSVTAMFLPDRKVSAWYIDVIENHGIDEDGIVYFTDKYLDVMMTPQGDVIVDDRDELDAAYKSGELTQLQYENALKEGEQILSDYSNDIKATETWCRKILDKAEEIISNDRFTIFLDIDGVMDVYDPSKAVQDILPEALEGLKQFIERTKADVVIVSDWRYGINSYREKALSLGFKSRIDNWDNLVKVFAEAGIEISGVTEWREDLKNRTEEIKAYLKTHSNIKRYVIFDDCFGDTFESDPEVHRHLVFVDALKGLQKQNFLDGCKVMNLQ